MGVTRLGTTPCRARRRRHDLYWRRMTPKTKSPRRTGRIPTFGLIGAVLCACTVPNALVKPRGGASDPITSGLRSRITTIVVIYAENRAFDNLYGNFPGAVAWAKCIDADGHPLAGVSSHSSIATAPSCRACRRPGAA